MRIGLPKEIKKSEGRVALRPDQVGKLVSAGHSVLVETGAGLQSGFEDFQYLEQGADLSATAQRVWSNSEMIVKVKEPIPEEYGLLEPGQILFTYLHLAANPDLQEILMQRQIWAFGYETLRSSTGNLPLLAPMSKIAGRLAVQMGAHYLAQPQGGKGVLLGGVVPGKVLILGVGVAGEQALDVAWGMGAEVFVLDVQDAKFAALHSKYSERLTTARMDDTTLMEWLPQMDLLIGAVLLPGRAAPKLIQRKHLQQMQVRSVFVDISIDQGGCAESSSPTTHAEPFFVAEGITHLCVANLPGAVPKSATLALTNATFPWLMALANHPFWNSTSWPKVQDLEDGGWSEALGTELSSALQIALGKRWIEF
jgi:alanine dehydrogenase